MQQVTGYIGVFKALLKSEKDSRWHCWESHSRCSNTASATIRHYEL